jgi:hypothetical protein
MQKSPPQYIIIDTTMSANDKDYSSTSSEESVLQYNSKKVIDVLMSSNSSSIMDKASPGEDPCTLITRLRKRPPTPQTRESVSPKRLTSSQKMKCPPSILMILQKKKRANSPKESSNQKKEKETALEKI